MLQPRQAATLRTAQTVFLYSVLFSMSMSEEPFALQPKTCWSLVHKTCSTDLLVLQEGQKKVYNEQGSVSPPGELHGLF